MTTREPPNLPKLLLAVLVCASLLGGCKTSKEPTVTQPGESPGIVTRGIRERIEQTVPDAERREALLNDMDEVDTALEQMARTLLTGLDTLASADTDREKRKDDFLATHEAIREARNDALRRYVDVRLEMRELLTQDEWDQISRNIPR